MVNIGRVSDRLCSSRLLCLGGSLVFGVSILAIPLADGLLTVAAPTMLPMLNIA